MTRTQDIGKVGVAFARQQLDAGRADARQRVTFLYYEVPAGRMGEAVRLGDLSAAHDRLARVIAHSRMPRDGWFYCGPFEAPRLLTPEINQTRTDP